MSVANIRGVDLHYELLGDAATNDSTFV